MLHATSADSLRERRRPALVAPVAHAKLARAFAEALGGLLGHLAGAEEQHRVAGEIAEDALARSTATLEIDTSPTPSEVSL
ncbi:MAG: hypothetical protein U0235_28005 [Polyangiaceae bacterium]